MLRIAIAGCSGRMGKALTQAVQNDNSIKITAATVSPSSKNKNQDIGLIAGIEPLQIKSTDNLKSIIDDFEILIDFTNPSATLRHLEICTLHQKKLVIGTTGLTHEQETLLKKSGSNIPILFAPNMSIGINLCFGLLKQAASVLGNSVDIEIIEAHHRHKLDAPSGTALKMGEVIASTLGRDLATVSSHGRQGMGHPRERETIGFSSIRGGDIVGEHTVIFAGEGERLEITHRASQRHVFAQGAIRAAKWLASKEKGFYTMQDAIFGDSCNLK
ncbi:MAG: 4-hydroxy-tetrahydrodipicolinate reductase [Gammaproteobacteria bacterium]